MMHGFEDGGPSRKAALGFRERARHASGAALSAVVSVSLVLGLAPSFGAYAAQGSGSEQLPSGTYWYNGDVSFTTIDSSNGFSSSIWDDYRDSGADGTGNALGIAGSFHLVAFDTLDVSSGSHVYGNMLAKHLTDNADFGTDSRFDDLYGHSTLSYIQDYQGTHPRFGANSFAKQAVVFGSNSESFGLFANESSGHQIINYRNSKTSGTAIAFPATIGQDLDSSSEPFIDFDAVKQEMENLSATLASRSSAGGATYDFSDVNSKRISYTLDSGCAYLDLPASELAKNSNKIDIVGLPGDGSGTLVINVDCEGSDVTLPDQINLYIGGKAVSFGEVDADTGCVLWNFYNCAGASIAATNMVGSILAPGASLTLGGNACGTFIADSIIVKAETHTRPFHGKLKPSDDTTSVSVEKVWLDSKGQPESGVSHDSVVAQLWYADENGAATEPVLDSQGNQVEVQLNDANDWKASFSGLPKKQGGVELHYTVVEASAPADYDSEVAAGDGNSFVISNRHKAQVDISALKEWNDADDADGLRPDSIAASIVRTARDGSKQVVGTLSLSEANGWKDSVSGLPAADDDGNEYSYSLKEASVEGYDSEVSLASTPSKDDLGNVSYEFLLVNTHKAKTIDVKVKKEWNDGGGSVGDRPDSVTARLCVLSGDGQKIPVEGAEDKVLSDENGWTASWDGLPANKVGERINYTVDEVDVPEGYELTDVSGVQEDGSYVFTMTNTVSQEEAFALTGYSVRSISGPDLQPEKVCYVDPKVIKKLEGRQLQEGEFKFRLINEKTGEVVSTASNEKSGMVDFDKGENNKNPDGMEACCLKFTEAGTYVYVVEEISEQKDPTIQYSSEVVKFVVNVSEVAGNLVSDGGTYYHYDSADDAVATYSIAGDSGDHPTITNSVKPVALGLKKANEQGAGLQGATYGLYRAGAEGEGNAVLVAQATSDAEGHMTFAAEPGAEPISEDVEYWFQEISAPDGYALSLDQSAHFRLLRSGEGSNTAYYLEYADGDKSDTYPVGEVVEFEDGAPVTDRELLVVLSKVDSARNAVSGARLGIREANSGETIAEWSSGEVGYVLRDVRANVAYVLYEQAAPDGYTKAGDVTFVVDECGNVTIVDGSSAAVNGQDVVNAFGVGNALSMVDYKRGEVVEKTSSPAEQRKFAKTGDSVHAEAAFVFAVGSLCVAAVARRTRRGKRE